MTTKPMSEADAVREATAILRALELRLHGDPVAADLGRIAKRLEEMETPRGSPQPTAERKGA